MVQTLALGEKILPAEHFVLGKEIADEETDFPIIVCRALSAVCLSEAGWSNADRYAGKYG